MKYRIKEIEDAGYTWFYPQYKKFLFWKFFTEWYRAVKWLRRWQVFFCTRKEAEDFIKNLSK